MDDTSLETTNSQKTESVPYRRPRTFATLQTKSTKRDISEKTPRTMLIKYDNGGGHRYASIEKSDIFYLLTNEVFFYLTKRTCSPIVVFQRNQLPSLIVAVLLQSL